MSSPSKANSYTESISIYMRIFISAMAGEGNLGDDLISSILIDLLTENYTDAEVGVLSGDQDNHFSYQDKDRVRLLKVPRKNNIKVFFARRAAIRDFVKDSEVLIVGGGGLLQDTHYMFNNHYWLKYRYIKKSMKSLLLGIGVGPFKYKFSKQYLSRILEDFDFIQVRDEYSDKSLKEINIDSVLSDDIVKGNELHPIFEEESIGVKAEKILGCSIRPWSDLNFDNACNLIRRCTNETGIQKVIFFVFEYTEQGESEYEYALKLSLVLKKEKIKCEVVCYNKNSIKDFILAFRKVDFAIASRFHANILWQKLKTPTIPISYAPKVRSIYVEHGGKAFSANELSTITSPSECYQTIDLNNNYSWPILDSIKHSDYSLFNFYFIKIISMISFVISITNSIWIRILKK